MAVKEFPSSGVADFRRRRFVQGLAAGGVLLGLSGLSSVNKAFSTEMPSAGSRTPVLSGTEFHLIIDQSPVNFTGKPRMAITINGSIPAPTLIWREGDTVTLRVSNRLAVDTSIHWHGIILPFEMDGVPGISFPGIKPGETFTYRFKVRQTGTYWYHSHSGFQEMLGMYGAIVIVPARGERIGADRDHVVVLSDWTDDDPMAVFARLKQQSDYYNFNQPTVADFVSDARRHGLRQAAAMRNMWNVMRMNPTDLGDLSGDTLTFLMNGTTPAGNWCGLFKRGERVRLRFINAASSTFYDVRIPGLTMMVVQADGQDVEPVSVDEFRFGPAETYDVIVEPVEDAYTIFAQTMERSGYARGTLGLDASLTAPVPRVDAPEKLGMTDMMGAMNHGGGDHGGIEHGGMEHGGRDHGQAMKHGGTHDGAHGAMAMNHAGHKGHNMGLAVPAKTVRHARSEYGPSVDMRVDMPRTNLDDPGVGLRNNGRRVLTLADLHSLDGVIDDRRLPVREIELHLTGNMERYSWSIDGLEFGQSTPVHMKHGERLRVILHNDTMMTHPMHLHGMWSDLEDDQGNLLARRHTIPVQPAQRISFRTTPHELGRWAWHCHLMFHMDAGMFREVVVS